MGVASLPSTAVRQLEHWRLASERLARLEDLASNQAWRSLEADLGRALLAPLQETIRSLQENINALKKRLDSLSSDQANRAIISVRRQYLRAEVTADFYTDAINTRTNPEIAALLRGLDAVAGEVLERSLGPLGKSVPRTLVYQDKGLGASILKAGLRLWDPASISAVAAIKIARHNTLRPTSLLHEAGHQIGHQTSGANELAMNLERELPGPVGGVWSSWSSELFADAVAFVFSGHASLVALADVVDGGPRMVFRYLPGDPHPISCLRVHCVARMCGLEFGSGPWDRLIEDWDRRYPVEEVPSQLQPLFRESLRHMDLIARITLQSPMKAFRGAPLSRFIPASDVSPAALRASAGELDRVKDVPIGVLRREIVRLIALTGLRMDENPASTQRESALVKTALVRLGAR